MNPAINTKRIPFGVLFIAAFYTFGAIFLFINIFTNPVGASREIAKVHGLSPIMGSEVLVTVGVLGLLIAYGLVRLSRWGYILTVLYLLYLATISTIMGGFTFLSPGNADKQIYFGNLLWSVMVLVYLFVVRRRFFEK